MAKRGRKLLYTPERREALLNAVSLGGSDRDACILAGISEDTLARWRAKEADFAATLERARMNGKLLRIGRVKQHGATDWRADAWYLERRWPEEYAQQLIVKLTTEQAAILKKNGLTPGQAMEQLIQELQHADAD